MVVLSHVSLLTAESSFKLWHVASLMKNMIHITNNDSLSSLFYAQHAVWRTDLVLLFLFQQYHALWVCNIKNVDHLVQILVLILKDLMSVKITV